MRGGAALKREVIVLPGGTTIVDLNAIPDIIVNLPVAGGIALAEAGKKMKAAIREEFQGQGFGEWHDKSEVQKLISGSDRIMDGITGTLHTHVKSKVAKDHFIKAPGTIAQRFVGWFDDTHPDPGVFGDTRQTPNLTYGELAWVHELGTADRGGSLPASGPSGASLLPLYPRPWATKAADERGYGVLAAGEEAFLYAISAQTLGNAATILSEAAPTDTLRVAAIAALLPTHITANVPAGTITDDVEEATVE